MEDNNIELLQVEGYNDGYYWDQRYLFSYGGYNFIYIDTGSGSGFVPTHRSIRYAYDSDLNDLLKGERIPSYSKTASFPYEEIEEYVSKLITSGEQEITIEETNQYFS